MSVRRRLVRSVAAVVALALVAGCGGSAGRQPHLGQTIRIGLNLEQSGDLAWYGDSALKGAQVAVDAVNAAGGIDGRPVEMVVADNGSQPGRTVVLSAKMMSQDKALAVLGPVTEDLFRATATVADRLDRRGVDAGVQQRRAGHDPAGPAPVRLPQLPGLPAAWRRDGELRSRRTGRPDRRCAAVHRGAYADFADGFSQRFTTADGQVVTDDVILPDDTDLWRYATRLAEAPADVVYVAAPPWETGHLIAQLRESGLAQPVLGIDELDDPALLEAAGAGALNRVDFSTDYAPWDTANPRVAQYIESYRNTWDGAEPSRSSALAHDATLMIIEAIRRAREPTGVEVQRAMAETQGLSGVTGRLRVTSDHETIKDALVVELVDGAPTAVTPVAP